MIEDRHCPFCILQREKIIETELSFAIYDGFPVNEGHVLVIPKRHTASYFDLTDEEKKDAILLLDKVKEKIEKKYKPEPKEPLDSTIAKSNDAIKSTSIMKDESGQVFYKVQLFASSKKKDLSKNEFKGLENISYTFENNLYRYYFGKSYDLSVVKKMHDEAKSHGFTDAFIVQFANGKVSALK
jgi:hypothetical protein